MTVQDRLDEIYNEIDGKFAEFHQSLAPKKRRKKLLAAINNNPELCPPRSLFAALAPRLWMIDAVTIKERAIIRRTSRHTHIRLFKENMKIGA